jgi:general secretion pathway protein E
MRSGMTTLRAAAVKLVAAGETTLEEINRVTIVD